MRGIAKTNNEVNKRLKEEQNGQVRFGQKEKKNQAKMWSIFEVRKNERKQSASTTIMHVGSIPAVGTSKS